MKEIVEQLEQWRKDRNINNEIDNNVEIANIFEELAEYYRASSDYERVDALCDISVFCFNWMGRKESLHMQEKIDELEIFEINYIGVGQIRYIAEELINLQYYYSSSYCIKIIKICIEMIRRLGYNYKACMFETIKEISSRQQDPEQAKEWLENGASGKWLKDKNQPKEALYTADYEKCKLGEIKCLKNTKEPI